MAVDSVQTEKLLYEGARLLGIPIEHQKLELLFQYYLELHKWNRKINLVARNTPIDISLEKHFLDSLTLVPLIKQYASPHPSLLDVGSGAGFPGLVLKTVYPELETILVEPRQKRSIFLRHIIRTLDLKKVEVKTMRIEDRSCLDPESSFSFVTSRALAEPAKFLAMITPLLKPETIVIFMQGQMDINQWFTARVKEQFTLLEHLELTLPFSKSRRQLVLIKLR